MLIVAAVAQEVKELRLSNAKSPRQRSVMIHEFAPSEETEIVGKFTNDPQLESTTWLLTPKATLRC